VSISIKWTPLATEEVKHDTAKIEQGIAGLKISDNHTSFKNEEQKQSKVNTISQVS